MSKELKTGIIVIVIIALGIWGFNFLKGKDFFGPSSRHFYVEYNNINGLAESSIVTINGLKVGHVESIQFNNSIEKRGSLVVKFSVDHDFEFSKLSIVKIYPAGLMGGQNLAIIPSYKGDIAVSNDVLKGEIESGMFDMVGEKLNPLQAKLESVLVGADSLLIGFNQILNTKSKESLNRSVLGLEGTVNGVRKTLNSVNGLLVSSKSSLTATLNNSEKITNDFSKISSDLSTVNFAETVKKIENSLEGVNNLIANVEKGQGTLGKLMTDDEMYTNLNNASKEMEELLRELKLNPKRFVHFSVFGKRAKAYDEKTNKKNVSNQ